MKTDTMALAFAALLILESMATAGEERESMKVHRDRMQKALAEAKGMGDGAAARGTLETALKSVRSGVGIESDAGTVIGKALEAAGPKGDREALGLLRAAAEEAMIALDYRPRVESAMPEGFPEPTPVGTIAVKEYPALRAAEASAGASIPGGRNILFLQLLRHIEKNEIPMTAPVVMDYTTAGREGEAMKMESMSFLYRSPEVGRTGKEGTVTVKDVGRMTALSLGLRGGYTRERYEEGLRRLEDWLGRNGDRYRKAGEPRVLAYNSPMVAEVIKYSEIQIPVEALKGTVTEGGARSGPRTF